MGRQEPENVADECLYTLPTPADIERDLEEHTALKEFNIIVSAGCDRNRILYLLFLLRKESLKSNDWRSLTGLDREQFRTALERMRDCAETVLRIGSHGIINPLVEMDPRIGDDFLRLPGKLRACATALEKCSKTFRPKKKPEFTSLMTELIQYVKRRTGRYHDNETATLLSVALEKPKWIYRDIQEWRRKQRLVSPKIRPQV